MGRVDSMHIRGAQKAYTNNIWRLNLKLSLARRGQRMSVLPDFDE